MIWHATQHGKVRSNHRKRLLKKKYITTEETQKNLTNLLLHINL